MIHVELGETSWRRQNYEMQTQIIQRSKHQPTPEQLDETQPTQQNEHQQVSHTPSPNQQQALKTTDRAQTPSQVTLSCQ